MRALSEVFVYGSLIYPQVWRRLVRGEHRGEPAVLQGWRRCALRDASYPGAVVDPAARIEGWLWHGVDAEDLLRLDAFEGAEYRRQAVDVIVDGSRVVRAEIYAFRDAQRLAPHDWDRAAFERGHLDTFADVHSAAGARGAAASDGGTR